MEANNSLVPDVRTNPCKKRINQDFPSLAISTFNHNTGGGEFELNAPEPIPIENDFFKGKILIHVRPRQDATVKEDLVSR